MADSTTALIAAAASLVVAGLSAVAAYKAQSRTLENQSELQRYQKDLKRLQAELDDRQAERDARRDYEYDALKRLYAECSPLVFTLAEQAASMRDRIFSLAQAASAGNLDRGPDSWLSAQRPRYYRFSTEYRLIAPLATVKLLQRRLTQLDLSLDPGMRLVHVLARQVARVVADEFALANSDRDALPYRPHAKEAGDRANDEPAVYWQQGIPSGILDNAAEALIVTDPGAAPRVASYMEFEHARADAQSVIGRAFARIEYLLADFHPRDRPVLWRLLLALSSLHRAIGIAADRHELELHRPSAESLLHLPQAELPMLDWRADKDDGPDAAAIASAHSAVRSYLLNCLKKPVDQCLDALVDKPARRAAQP